MSLEPTLETKEPLFRGRVFAVERLHLSAGGHGFTREVARLMRMSNFFIGKPGPASISEALSMGLPVIVERNHFTMPQERYNTQWVEEGGYGIAVRSFRRDIVRATAEMLDPEKRRRFVERASGYRNRAVFEIPPILEKILAA